MCVFISELYPYIEFRLCNFSKLVQSIITERRNNFMHVVLSSLSLQLSKKLSKSFQHTYPKNSQEQTHSKTFILSLKREKNRGRINSIRTQRKLFTLKRVE